MANKDRVASDETKEKLREAARAQWNRPGAREAQSKKMKECNNSRGSNHQKTNKAVVIDGVEYISISEAARQLNTTRNTIKRKLR